MSTQSATDRLDNEGWRCARCGRFVAWAASSNALALPRLGASTADPRKEDGGIEKVMGVAGGLARVAGSVQGPHGFILQE